MYLSKRFAALPPHRKLRARLALYGGITAGIVALVLVIAWLARPSRGGKDQVFVAAELMDRPEVLLLQDYLRIDTSPTTGSELAGAEFLADQLEAAGLEPHIERLGEGKANLWAVLEGRRREALVLHNHIDVYPVEDPEAWDFHPFEGIINQAWLYGRGAFDMKSVAIAQLLAIGDLAAHQEQPERSVIFLASGSEEIGSELGTRWILARHPELADRFWAVLTEGGVVEAISHEEIKYWGIESAQKWFANGWACSDTLERLEDLKQDLADLSDANHELRITPEVSSFLAAYAASRTASNYQEILSDLSSALDHPGRFRSLPPYLKSLLREEVVTFPIEADTEGGYRMRVILHLLPGSEFDSWRQRLLPDWALHGVSLTLGAPLGADHGSPDDHPAFQGLQSELQETYPKARVGPYFLCYSATDSRFFRQKGIPSYGFSPFLIFATDTFRRDTTNERIDVPGYVAGVELYRRAVARLAN